LGLARTGIAAANYLAKCGADVVASDLKKADELPLASLHPAIQVRPEATVVRAGDLVIISPGIKPKAPAWKLAHEKGSAVISDIELFYLLCPCPIVAITGTDGKSTTTALIGKLLEGLGYPTFVGGNIGLACMEGLPSLTAASVAVLEVSCFQLEHCYRFSPAVAVVTNIAEDHIEYHGSMEGYVAAKKRVFQAMGAGSTLVLNGDDLELARWSAPPGVEVRRFGWARRGRPGTVPEASARPSVWADEERTFVRDRALVSHGELKLKGLHNIENVMAAVAAVEGRFGTAEALLPALQAFPGLEHRMEYVATLEGVEYYNDSKATNPHAATAVLNAFAEPFWLLAGGYEKGSDFTEFGRLVAARTKGAVLYGVCRERIRSAIPEGHTVRVVETMEQALDVAREMARPGDRVVLAPACASFDQFKDFEHRGTMFKEAVLRLAGGGSPDGAQGGKR
jgi:UDP-N-acetylmuramoylalanine--D-glutamate ligase